MIHFLVCVRDGVEEWRLLRACKIKRTEKKTTIKINLKNKN